MLVGAFGRVWHGGIIAKWQHFGITDGLLVLLEVCLHERILRSCSQRPVLSEHSVRPSALQGVCLGPSFGVHTSVPSYGSFHRLCHKQTPPPWPDRDLHAVSLSFGWDRLSYSAPTTSTLCIRVLAARAFLLCLSFPLDNIRQFTQNNQAANKSVSYYSISWIYLACAACRKFIVNIHLTSHLSTSLTLPGPESLDHTRLKFHSLLHSSLPRHGRLWNQFVKETNRHLGKSVQEFKFRFQICRYEHRI